MTLTRTLTRKFREEIHTLTPPVLDGSLLTGLLATAQQLGYGWDFIFTFHGLDNRYVLATVNFDRDESDPPDKGFTVTRPFADSPADWVKYTFGRKTKGEGAR